MSRTLAALLLASASIFASAPASIAFAETTVITQQAPATIHYRSMKIDGVNVFYREAGPADGPRRRPASRLSDIVPHVPQPDPAARRPLPRHRP